MSKTERRRERGHQPKRGVMLPDGPDDSILELVLRCSDDELRELEAAGLIRRCSDEELRQLEVPGLRRGDELFQALDQQALNAWLRSREQMNELLTMEQVDRLQASGELFGVFVQVPGLCVTLPQALLSGIATHIAEERSLPSGSVTVEVVGVYRVEGFQAISRLALLRAFDLDGQLIRELEGAPA